MDIARTRAILKKNVFLKERLQKSASSVIKGSRTAVIAENSHLENKLVRASPFTLHPVCRLLLGIARIFLDVAFLSVSAG